MKPLPPPNVPGTTEWERFDNAFRKIITVPKEAFLKEEADLKQAREKKRQIESGRCQPGEQNVGRLPADACRDCRGQRERARE